MKKTLLMFLVGTALVLPSTSKADLLTNGSIDDPLFLSGWTITNTVTGSPGAPVEASKIQDFANHDAGGSTGLWLEAFQGNLAPYNGQNKKINADLSQSVSATPGETYTLTGWSKWETNYSGGVTTLDATSPSGAVPSPTNSAFTLTFLNGAVPIGSQSLDLRTVQTADGTFRQHTVTAVAPVNTTNVKVSATATDMVFNKDPSQSGFYDDFSLTAASAPATEKLVNGKLNDPYQSPGWSLARSPAGADTAEFIDFADHDPNPGLGLWLRAFATGAIPNGAATLSQIAPATPGFSYTFSGWSRWEANWPGGLTGTPTQTQMQLAFLDASNTVIGTPVTLDLRTVQQDDGNWRQHVLQGIAPAGTVKIQVSAGASGMFDAGGAQGAFFDDFSLVPEPASAVLSALGILGFLGVRRRR